MEEAGCKAEISHRRIRTVTKNQTSEFVPTPPGAGPNPQKYEYTCIYFRNTFGGDIFEVSTEELNKYGAQGWRMVTSAVDGGYLMFYLERPIQ